MSANSAAYTYLVVEGPPRQGRKALSWAIDRRRRPDGVAAPRTRAPAVRAEEVSCARLIGTRAAPAVGGHTPGPPGSPGAPSVVCRRRRCDGPRPRSAGVRQDDSRPPVGGDDREPG